MGPSTKESMSKCTTFNGRIGREKENKISDNTHSQGQRKQETGIEEKPLEYLQLLHIFRAT